MKSPKLVRPVVEVKCACCNRAVSTIVNEGVNTDGGNATTDFPVLYQKVTGHLLCGRCLVTHCFIQKYDSAVVVYNARTKKYKADIAKVNEVIDLVLSLEDTPSEIRELFQKETDKLKAKMNEKKGG